MQSDDLGDRRKRANSSVSRSKERETLAEEEEEEEEALVTADDEEEVRRMKSSVRFSRHVARPRCLDKV
jgi:hypothetical protein